MYIVFVKEDQHAKSVDQLLREIALLERNLATAGHHGGQEKLGKALHLRLKKLERMIPYPFRRELDNLCQCAGIDSHFLS